MDNAAFERGVSQATGVVIRFSSDHPNQALIDVGNSTPRLTVDVSQVRQLIPQKGPAGKPAVEIVSDDVLGELAVTQGDIAFSPLRDLYSEVYMDMSIEDEGLPILIGWHDAYHYLDLVEETISHGDEDATLATVLRCLAYRWGALQAGIAVWESDFDFRLNSYDHELISEFGQENGRRAIEDSGASVDGGCWVGSDLELRLLNFRNADLSGCRLHGGMTGSDFSGANLQNAELRNCDLSHCNFVGADLRGSDLAGSLITGARFSEPSAIRTHTSDGAVTFLGWVADSESTGPDREPPTTSDSTSESSESGPGLISRVRTALHSARFGPQPGNWSMSFDPNTDMFAVQRTSSTRRPRGARSLNESGKLEIEGWEQRNEDAKLGRETYVEQVRFTLEDLCNYSDVRLVSDEVLHGWQNLVAAARASGTTETVITGDNNLFDHDAARPPREAPAIEMTAEQTVPDDNTSRWSTDAATAFTELHYTFSGSGIDIPMVPLPLMSQLTYETGPIWSTDPDIDPSALYRTEQLDLRAMIAPERDDFWVFGLVRGAFGLLTRIGPILLFQQSWYSNGYVEPFERDLQRCCNGVRSWNTSLVAFKKLDHTDVSAPKILIAFSDFQHYPVIKEINPSEAIVDVREGFWFEAVPGRTIYTSTSFRTPDPVLTALQGSQDPVISAAATHLGLLMEGTANEG